MSKPTISVIMAAYNCSSYINAAIDSLLDQTFQDFEIIIVDDFSTDNTVDLILNYSDSRIKLLRNTSNSGASFSRNKAINESKGEYLAILDADDISLPNRFYVQYHYLSTNPQIDVVGSFIHEIDSIGNLIRKAKVPTNVDEVKSSSLFRCSIVHSTAMIRRDFFVSNNLFYNLDFPSAQDYEMWSRAIFVGKISNIPQYLVQYRRSENQISSRRKDQQRNLADSVYNSFFLKLGISPSEDTFRIHRILTLQETVAVDGSMCSEVLNWVLTLNFQNLKTNVFDINSLANELILRYLRFLVLNRVSFFYIIRFQLKLHISLRQFYFPYFNLLNRLS